MIQALDDRCVENWLSRLKPSTAKMARRNLGLFMKWLRTSGTAFANYSPEMLIEYQRNADKGHQYDILDLVQAHILSSARATSNCSKH